VDNRIGSTATVQLQWTTTGLVHQQIQEWTTEIGPTKQAEWATGLVHQQKWEWCGTGFAHQQRWIRQQDWIISKDGVDNNNVHPPDAVEESL